MENKALRTKFNMRFFNAKFDIVKFGIGMSGGGARGAAHIGVLKVLDKKLNIVAVAGASAGAIVAVAYSAGKLKKLEKKVKSITKRDVQSYFRLSRSKEGLFDSSQIENFMREIIGDVKLEDLDKKTIIVASDIKAGRPIYFTKGDAAKVVAASSAIPGLFTPVKIKNMILVDGGLFNNLPVRIIKEEMEKNGEEIKTIGVDVTSSDERLGKATKYLVNGVQALDKRIIILKERINNNPKLSRIERLRLVRAVLDRIGMLRKNKELLDHNPNYNLAAILIRAMTKFKPGENMDVGDYTIKPNVKVFNLDFYKAKQAIGAGEKAAKKFLKELKHENKHENKK